MNTNEAISIKEKLEEVLIVIDEYGKQAKQFSETRDVLSELIKKFSATNDAFTNTVINSDEFLRSAQKLIDIDYVAKIKEKVNEISEMEVTHQNECNDELSKISALAESFEAKASNLVENQSLLQGKIDGLFEKVDELIHSVASEKDEVLKRLDSLGERIETSFSIIEKLTDNSQIAGMEVSENSQDGLNQAVIDEEKKNETMAEEL